MGFFSLLQTYLVKTMECTDGLKHQRAVVPVLGNFCLWIEIKCEIDTVSIKSSTRNMGYHNTGSKETNQEWEAAPRRMNVAHSVL